MSPGSPRPFTFPGSSSSTSSCHGCLTIPCSRDGSKTSDQSLPSLSPKASKSPPPPESPRIHYSVQGRLTSATSCTAQVHHVSVSMPQLPTVRRRMRLSDRSIRAATEAYRSCRPTAVQFGSVCAPRCSDTKLRLAPRRTGVLS